MEEMIPMSVIMPRFLLGKDTEHMEREEITEEERNK